MITRKNSACYYEGSHGPAGFEYDLVKAFADHLGLPLRVRIIEEEADMVAALGEGKGDIIAAGFPFGEQTIRRVAVGPGYLEVKHQIVGRRGGADVRREADLNNYTLWMAESSAGIETLETLKETYPKIGWQVSAVYSAEDLLRMVWCRFLPITLVDSNIMAMNHQYYPELKILLSLGQPRQLAWATDPRNRRLNDTISSWFDKKETREFIHGLKNHYYGHLETFDYVDLARYHRRIRTRLPKYRPVFEAAAGQFNLDWMLVAALSYQESHWNPNARSHTGVRGIMMLTLDTAAGMGLEDRLDVDASIHAGTRYLANLYRQVGSNVPEPDRTLLALAAYNIGFGHLEDARILARRMGKPDDTWHGVRSVLPLLQQKKYYATLAHRYARGKETVRYVDRIRNYYNILLNALKTKVRDVTQDDDLSVFPGL